MTQFDDAEIPLKPLKISSRQILLLNALDRYRNMRRAAAAMHTTQPTASQLLQQLESRLKVKLFERLPRGMEPTLYGEVLIRYARSVNQDFEHAETEIAELAKGALGFVRIGSVMGAVPTALTRRLLDFKAAYPRVRISLDVGTSDTILPLLARGDLDLAIGRVPDGMDSQDFAIDFFDEPERMSLIARPGHPLSRKKNVRIADLLTQTWILHPIGSPMRLRVESALRQSLEPAFLDVVETTSLLATTSLIQASDMVSVVPFDVATHYASCGLVTIIPIDLPVSMVNLGVITRKSKTPAPALLGLLGYLKSSRMSDAGDAGDAGRTARS